MEQTGIFEGIIIGANTKLRTEHSIAGGNATVVASYGKDLKVVADQKWTCDVADAAKLVQVGDVWMHVTHIGGINVVDGWMAVKHHGAAIVNLTVDLPDGEIPPVVPPDRVVVASLTLDFNADHEIVGMWVNNGQEWVPYNPAIEPPVG